MGNKSGNAQQLICGTSSQSEHFAKNTKHMLLQLHKFSPIHQGMWVFDFVPERRTLTRGSRKLNWSQEKRHAKSPEELRYN